VPPARPRIADVDHVHKNHDNAGFEILKANVHEMFAYDPFSNRKPVNRTFKIYAAAAAYFSRIEKLSRCFEISTSDPIGPTLNAAPPRSMASRARLSRWRVAAQRNFSHR
jgi:hypothetical protein